LVQLDWLLTLRRVFDRDGEPTVALNIIDTLVGELDVEITSRAVTFGEGGTGWFGSADFYTHPNGAEEFHNTLPSVDPEAEVSDMMAAAETVDEDALTEVPVHVRHGAAVSSRRKRPEVVREKRVINVEDTDAEMLEDAW